MITAVMDEEFLSLIRFKLEALVELCHLSPALLLYGSARACKLQMGFSWALMQTGLHRPDSCRKQAAKSVKPGKREAISKPPAALVHLMQSLSWLLDVKIKKTPNNAKPETNWHHAARC